MGYFFVDDCRIRLYNENMTYEKIIESLSQAKKTRNPEDAKGAIIKSMQMFKEFISSVRDYSLLSPFSVLDKDFLFPEVRSEILEGVIEAEVSTTGLLSQVLEQAGFVDANNLTVRLQDLIMEFHQNLSMGADEKIESSRQKILDLLNEILVVEE